MDSVAQESNNDLINRGEILSYIDKVINQGTGKHKSLEFIRKYAEMMPSTQSEQRWIPVTERLPEECEDIIVTYVDDEETRIIPVNYGKGT